jgi:hypothetical protein
MRAVELLRVSLDILRRRGGEELDLSAGRYLVQVIGGELVVFQVTPN